MVWIICKGSPEVIFSKSHEIIIQDEIKEKFTSQMKAEIEESIEKEYYS